MNRLRWILFVTLLAGPGLALSQTGALPTLTVGYYEFPPGIYSDAQGKASGPLVDLTRRVLERAGYEARFRALPSARLYAALEDGTIDLWPGAPGKPELVAHTLEGRQILTHISLNLYFRRDTLLPRIPEDLAGRGLIVIAGYNYWPGINGMLQDPALGLRLHRTSNHVSALEMLEHRRADFLLDYQLPLNQARQLLGMGELPFVVMHKVPIKFIVSRHAKDGHAIVEALNHAYADMAEAGEDLSLPGE